MGRVYLELNNGKWNRVASSSFWLDEPLLNRLDSIKMIQRKKWDAPFLIDGPERSGKSVLGFQCAWYLSDGKITINNFALGLEDAARKISELPDESVLIVDEGSLIFSSRQSQTKAQRLLMEILDVVGQKRLIFIIILPCFFDLNKTIAVRRSRFLLHVYPDEKYNRGRYLCWGEKRKAQLYRIGKKNFDSYEYPKASDEPGMYPDWHPPFWEEYEEKVKKVTLNRVLKNAVDNGSEKFRERMIITVGRLRKFHPFTQDQLASIFGVTQNTICLWLQEYSQMEDDFVVFKKELRTTSSSY